ncbi:uncharacterized protein BKA78DRAFT_126213 [Phyllosticta capitalensis]|uniref:uncharacterized protein n=1 Tax=Phyllosticta capitalensis TaxID=121624 RepID=UPI003130A443
MALLLPPSIPESGTFTNPPLLPTTTTTRVILTSLIGHPFTHQEALSSSPVTAPSIRESHSPCLARAAASLAPTLSAMYRGEVDRSALLGIVCSPSAFANRVREADGRSSVHPPVSGRGWGGKPVDGLSGEKTSLLADADCACEVERQNHPSRSVPLIFGIWRLRVSIIQCRRAATREQLHG